MGHTIIVDQQIKNISFKIYVRKNNSQAHYVYTQLLDGKKIYEPSIIVCLNSILKNEKKPVFADVGAFVGHYSCYVSKFLNYDLPVYALESNDKFCEDLKKSASLSKISNIEVLNCLLSDKKEELFAYDVTVMNPDELQKKKLVDSDYLKKVLKFGKKKFTTTMDDVFKKKKIIPNILKMDVHGAEGKILFGSKNLLKKNVNYLLMELHTSKDLEKYSPGFTKADIIKGLIDLDFNCHIISPHSDGHRNLIATDRTTQQSYLNNTSKLKYLKIEKDLTASVLYDRNFSDIFILAIKKEININSLDCF
jgi:FkbM family methyltransferase